MKKNYIFRTLAFVLCVVLHASVAVAAERFIDFSSGKWTLNAGGRVAIYVSPDDERGVARAVESLRQDLQKVCGADVVLVDKAEDATIVVGTAGRVGAVKAFSKQLKGKHEMYVIEAAAGRMTIAGSDRRGTIFGIYELSRQLGVSPWYWWADAHVERHDSVYVTDGTYTDGEPAVKYRGLFLNDEMPCLGSWVKNTFGTDYGDHRFYEKVFELILRLKGNMLWPAMWAWAFYATTR